MKEKTTHSDGNSRYFTRCCRYKCVNRCDKATSFTRRCDAVSGVITQVSFVCRWQTDFVVVVINITFIITLSCSYCTIRSLAFGRLSCQHFQECLVPAIYIYNGYRRLAGFYPVVQPARQIHRTHR